jgi:hypothetical protein
MSAETSFSVRISGVTITDIRRMEYSFEGTVEEEVNVVFAQVDDGTWTRFFFDAGVFIWRDVQIPEATSNEGPHSYRVVPIDVSWLRESPTVEKVEFTGTEGDLERAIALIFTGDRQLVLRNADDHNSLSVGTTGANQQLQWTRYGGPLN